MHTEKEPARYNEEDRDAELELAPSIAPGLGVGERLFLSIQEAEIGQGGRQCLCTLRTASGGVQAFASYAVGKGDDALVGRAMTLVYRACAFPMLPEAVPARPCAIYVARGMEGRLQDEAVRKALEDELYSALRIPLEYGAGRETYCRVCGEVGGKLSACSRCMAVHYCGVGCQTKDWKEGGHGRACKAVKGVLTKSVGGHDGRITPEELGCMLEEMGQDRSLWGWDALVRGIGLSGRVNRVEREKERRMGEGEKRGAEEERTAYERAGEAREMGLCGGGTTVLSSPFGKDTGYASASRAVDTWELYQKARGIPGDGRVLMAGLWPALTLYHILSRGCGEGGLPLGSGSYICVHIPVGPRTDPRWSILSRGYRALGPLFPGVTLDVFLVGPDVGHGTWEWKEEGLRTCIRVHFAQGPYAEFPRDKYPAHVVVGEVEDEEVAASFSPTAWLALTAGHPVDLTPVLVAPPKGRRVRPGPTSPIWGNPLGSIVYERSVARRRRGYADPTVCPARYYLLYSPVE